MVNDPTCAGVSVSLIGWPSNLNLICLIWRPWEKQRSRHGDDSLSNGLLTHSVRLNRPLNSPVVHSKPSWVCWVVCAFWFWTEPQNHPVLQPWGWCDHSRSWLPPAETNASLCQETESTKCKQRILYYYTLLRELHVDHGQLWYSTCFLKVPVLAATLASPLAFKHLESGCRFSCRLTLLALSSRVVIQRLQKLEKWPATARSA